jgi:RHS repeat-associated protein
MSDGSGLKAESYSYDVYGTPTFCNGSGVVTNVSAVGNRLLFTARDRDPDTGWHNYRHRYYNPTLGRFTQKDPVGVHGKEYNLYRYVANSPVRWVDATGQAMGGINRAAEKFGGIQAVGLYNAWGIASEIAREANEIASTLRAQYMRDHPNASPERVQNALRHGAWQALLTFEFGEEKARLIGGLHELGEEYTADSRVDECNNKIGRRIGKNKNIEQLLEQALYNGDLIIDNSDPRTPPWYAPPPNDTGWGEGLLDGLMDALDGLQKLL